MPDIDLGPGERLDDLIINGLKIIQHEDEFCFSLDAILLAHFVSIRPGIRAVDLGTGTGVIALLLTARGAGHVTGLEINPRMVGLARRSAALNGLSDRIEVLEADMRKVRDTLPAEKWDVVVSNPPYRPVGGGYVSPNDKVAMARHEVAASLKDVISAAKHLVKYRGRFAMVHLPERTAEILKLMSEAGLEAKRLRMVYPHIGKKPKFLLVEGVRGANPGLDVLPPLIIYNSDGTYTDDIMDYYRNQGR